MIFPFIREEAKATVCNQYGILGVVRKARKAHILGSINVSKWISPKVPSVQRVQTFLVIFVASCRSDWMELLMWNSWETLNENKS